MESEDVLVPQPRLDWSFLGRLNVGEWAELPAGLLPGHAGAAIRYWSAKTGFRFTKRGSRVWRLD